jgi:NTP pyrophosphatase (non-canonical NTP hydrolase)
VSKKKSKSPLDGIPLVSRETSDLIIEAGLKELQRRISEWNVAYKPKYKRTPAYTIAHMTEEFGEMAGEWRAGRISRTFGEDFFGLQHPEGLGSEIADVLGMTAAFADIMGLSAAEDTLIKLHYLEQKLAEKQKKGAKRGRVPKKA